MPRTMLPRPRTPLLGREEDPLLTHQLLAQEQGRLLAPPRSAHHGHQPRRLARPSEHQLRIIAMPAPASIASLLKVQTDPAMALCT